MQVPTKSGVPEAEQVIQRMSPIFSIFEYGSESFLTVVHKQTRSQWVECEWVVG